MKTRRPTPRTLVALLSLSACARLYESASDASDSSADSPPRSLAPESLAPSPSTLPFESSGRLPPPISGGTLAVLRDGRTAVASDPDLDVLWLADLDESSAPRHVELRAHDEPGRVVEGPANTVYVALRRDAILALDTASATVIARRTVCKAPRGVAWDEAAGLVHLACADGDLVSLRPDLTIASRRTLSPDLRDVVVADGSVYVSTMRTATLTRVRGGEVSAAATPGGDAFASVGRTTSVAWRTVASQNRITMLAQHIIPANLDDSGDIARSGYGSATPIVVPGLGWLDLSPTAPPNTQEGRTITEGGLAVDFAVSPGAPIELAVASPGWAWSERRAQVTVYDGAPVVAAPSSPTTTAAVPLRQMLLPGGQAVAVAYTPDRRVVVQTRSPAALFIERLGETPRSITLSDTPVGNSGFSIFHTVTRSGFACATCHPEGADDGLTWSFARAGVRRTPSLGGGITGTAPFHWSGDVADVSRLASTVFTARMHGPAVGGDMVALLSQWLDSIPATPIRERDAASIRGEALFRSTETGCASCHSGPQRTDNRTVDVGTGGAFQVPRLVGLAAHAPYMHDGCAHDLRARFTDPACGGGERHGHTSQLSAAQLDDLIAYLDSL